MPRQNTSTTVFWMSVLFSLSRVESHHMCLLHPRMSRPHVHLHHHIRPSSAKIDFRTSFPCSTKTSFALRLFAVLSPEDLIRFVFVDDGIIQNLLNRLCGLCSAANLLFFHLFTPSLLQLLQPALHKFLNWLLKPVKKTMGDNKLGRSPQYSFSTEQ